MKNEKAELVGIIFADVADGSDEADELARALFGVIHSVASSEDRESAEVEFCRLIYARTGDAARALDRFAARVGVGV